MSENSSIKCEGISIIGGTDNVTFKVRTGDQGFVLEKMTSDPVEVLTLDFPTSSLTLTKNGKEYKTNTSNLNKFFKEVEVKYGNEPKECQLAFLRFLSPPNCPEMYVDLFLYLGDYKEGTWRYDSSLHYRLSRFFTNLVTDLLSN